MRALWLGLFLLTAAPATAQEEHAEQLQLAQDLLELSRSFLAEEAVEDAEGALAAALEELAQVPDGDERALLELLRQLGAEAERQQQLGLLSEARHRARACLEGRRPEDDLELQVARLNVAVVMQAMGDLDESHELLEGVDAAWRTGLSPENPMRQVAMGNLAVSRRRRGDLEGALALGEELLELRESLHPPEHPVVLESRMNLAIALKTVGQTERAHALVEGVHAVWSRTLPPDHADLMAAKVNLASSRRSLGDYEGARELYGAVLEVWERRLPADDPRLETVRLDLAASCCDLGDAERAAELQAVVQRARSERLPVGHPGLTALAINRASTLHLRGERAEAIALLERTYAEALEYEHGSARDSARIRFDLGVLKLEAGELEEALAELEAVHAEWAAYLPADHNDLLDVRSSLCLALALLADRDAARARALEQLEGMLRLLERARTGSPRESRATAQGLARDVDRALFAAERGILTPAELFTLVESRRHVGVAPSLAGEDDDAFVAQRREVARLVRELGERVAAGPGEDESVEAWRVRVLELAEARDLAQRELYAGLAGAGRVGARIEPSVVAGALSPGSRAVGYPRYSSLDVPPERRSAEVGAARYLDLVLGPDGRVRRVELGSATHLEELLHAWRTALGAPLAGRGLGVAAPTSEAGARAAGSALRRALLDPVLATEVGSPAITSLFVCPDEVLHLVPLDALPSDAGTPVGDALALRTEVSFARLGAPPAPSEAPPGLLALGGIDYGAGEEELEAGAPAPELARSRAGALAGWTELPGSEAEVRSIAALFGERFELGARVLTGAQASKEALFRMAPGQRYLHVATHGWFAPEAMLALGDERSGVGRTMTGHAPMTLCGLSLAGANRALERRGRAAGLATAEELSGLDLSACELVVLSACETHVGARRAGLGIASLQSALAAAGARTTVTSLWKVDDQATRRLFEQFYRELWRAGRGKADALWQAKRALRQAGHPLRDWAGWVLSGDPD